MNLQRSLPALLFTVWLVPILIAQPNQALPRNQFEFKERQKDLTESKATLMADVPSPWLPGSVYGKRKSARLIQTFYFDNKIYISTMAGMVVLRNIGGSLKKMKFTPYPKLPGEWLKYQDPLPRIGNGGVPYVFTKEALYRLERGDWKVVFSVPDPISSDFESSEPFLLADGKVLVIGTRLSALRIYDPSQGWAISKNIPYSRKALRGYPFPEPIVSQVNSKWVAYFPWIGDLIVIDPQMDSSSSLGIELPWDVIGIKEKNKTSTSLQWEVDTPMEIALIPVDGNHIAINFRRIGNNQPVETTMFDIHFMEVSPSHPLISLPHPWHLNPLEQNSAALRTLFSN